MLRFAAIAIAIVFTLALMALVEFNALERCGTQPPTQPPKTIPAPTPPSLHAAKSPLEIGLGSFAEYFTILPSMPAGWRPGFGRPYHRRFGKGRDDR